MVGKYVDLTESYKSLSEALKHIADNEEAFIIGGASLYKEGLAVANRLYLTEIDAVPPHADVFFPEYDDGTWQIETKEERPATADTPSLHLCRLCKEKQNRQ